VGNPTELSYAPKGYPYFLSTTRSKVGDYHRYIGNAAAMFVLDGQRLANRYPVKPIDYWERAWQHSPGRTREAEDRVFSKKSTIPISVVRELHLLIREQDDERGQSARIRQLMILAKKTGIPVFLYSDASAWRLQDTRRALSPAEAASLLRGAERFPYGRVDPRSRRDSYNYEILRWIELIKTPTDQPLSKAAAKILYNLRYSFGGRRAADLENALFNAKKPSEFSYRYAVLLTDYLTKNNMNTQDLADMLMKKWEGVRT
jgi:hypothetical protein